MAIQDYLDSMEDTCTPIGYVETENGQFETEAKDMLFSWSKKGVGFGQLQFYFIEEDGKAVMHCDNECMSKERVKEILSSMVDNAVFDDVLDQ